MSGSFNLGYYAPTDTITAIGNIIHGAVTLSTLGMNTVTGHVLEDNIIIGNPNIGGAFDTTTYPNNTYICSSCDSTTEPTVGDIGIVIGNAYDPNRAHAAVYNWDDGDSVTLDVSSVFDDGDTVYCFNAAIIACTAIGSSSAVR